MIALAPWFRGLILFAVIVGAAFAVVLIAGTVYISFMEAAERRRRRRRGGYLFDREKERLPL